VPGALIGAGGIDVVGERGEWGAWMQVLGVHAVDLDAPTTPKAARRFHAEQTEHHGEHPS
jgi:hypothetical protein